MAEETKVEETTEQESPTVEENQPETEVPETAEKPEQTPEAEEEGGEPEQPEEDRNWRAMRDKLSALEEENKALKDVRREESAIASTKTSDLTGAWLSTEDNMSLQLDEFKATQAYPELDPDSEGYDPLFEKIVAGEYRRALDRYVNDNIAGNKTALPKASSIARTMKKTWDERFGDISEKAKKAGADAQKQAVKGKEATVEAEGRGNVGREPTDEEEEALKYKSRRGDYDAVAERIVRSGL